MCGGGGSGSNDDRNMQNPTPKKSRNNIINSTNPNEIYNFADQDHVGWSYEIPSYSFRTTALSVIEIFEILRKNKKKN